MKKIYPVLLSLLIINVLASNAQQVKHCLSGGINTETVSAQRKHCFTDEVYHETIKQHPEVLQKEKELEDFTRDFISNNHPEYRSANSVVYIIPLVFHVIHEYGPENISDDQIKDAVRILNRDYRKLNADTANIIPDFVSLAADIEVEFRLATIDPNGHCTNGIDRIVSYRTHIGDDNAKFNPWPRNKYLNIWTVGTFGGSHTGAAAYAYLPGSVPNANVDGVIALSDYVGSIGTSSVTNSRTLTHEIGHCFNLQHPWGNTNQPGVACGDDQVGDTPLTKGWDHCPSSNFDICTAGINENFQNYMDYSYCDCMFTLGQKARMIAALNSSTASRNNLWTASNLTATGTDGSATIPCAPVADFYPMQNHFCSGDSVVFVSACYNTDTITTYSWSFPSGTPSSSTSQNVYVTYPTPGQYDATLIASNPYGTDTLTKTFVVTVSGPATINTAYTDDFETAGTFPGTGYIINDGGSTWQRVTNAGYSGTASIRMPNYNATAGVVDSWVTPAFDLTNATSSYFKFRMAYARKDVTKTDVLKIFISTNCGKSWIARKTYSGSSLATTANVTTSFIPTSQNQWRLDSVPIGPWMSYTNVRMKFEFTSGGDENLFIDDINIIGPTGINEINVADLNFEIYPNPATNLVNILFDMPQFDKATMNLTDLLGREVRSVVNDRLNKGVHEYTLNTSELSKGIYFIQLKAGELSTVKKLVIE